MKTTARTLTALIAVAVGLLLVSPRAGAQSVGSGSLPGGGNPAPSPADARRQCDDLLERARQAMAENNLAGAEQLIAQAESLGVRYPALHLGDTPARARRDLERKRQGGGPTLPSRLFSPLSNAPKTAPTANPFDAQAAEPVSVLPDAKSTAKSYILRARQELAQGNTVAAAYWHQKAAAQQAAFGPNEDSPARLAEDIRRMAAQVEPTVAAAAAEPAVAVTPLPPVGQITPMAPPASTLPAPSGAAAAPDRQQSDNLLVGARRALALGDVRTAKKLTAQARSLNVPYGRLDDSPDRIDTLVDAYGDLMAQRAERGNTEGYRRLYAKVLMEQSDGLLRWRDFDEAERLANLAARQNVTYGPFDVKPETLLERIAAERRRSNPTLSAGPSGGAGEMAGAPMSPPISMAAKQRVVQLVQQARAAMAAGDLRTAEELARQAEAVQLPPGAFLPNEDRPGLVLLDVQQARFRGTGVVPAGGEMVAPATGSPDMSRRAAPAVYDPANDPTWNMQATVQQPPPPAAPRSLTPFQEEPSAMGPASPGMALVQQGEAALRNNDLQSALQYFRQSAAYFQEMDPVTVQRVQDFLQQHAVRSMPPAGSPGAPTALANDPAAQQQLLARKVVADLAHQESTAMSLRDTEPKKALAMLEQARATVAAAGLDPATRDQLLRRVDGRMAELRQFIESNRPRIELDERNQRTRSDVERQRQVTLEVQEKLALLVDEFNQLMREQRFAEAEVVAKRAAELDPQNPLAQQLVLNARFVRQFSDNLALRDEKEQAFLRTLDSVDRSSIPQDDRNPYVMPGIREWNQLTDRRARHARELGRKRSERELEIEQKLRTPVMLQFTDAPLAKVMDYLAKLADVNLHLDPQGIQQEGVTTDTPVTINLSKEISLQSALHLILEPLHLSYVIKDEVLKVTSEQNRDGEVYVQTYNVADLVVPIPNFVPSSSMGLARAYENALGNVGFGGGSLGGSTPPVAVMASRDGSRGSAAINPAVMAQMTANMPNGGGPVSVPMAFGPGNLGGGPQADFDSLIDLITSTIQPTTWDTVGGPGSIAPFETNLSLVVSQTQDVHEEIVDLLEQLRRLQDLQVTIEVRFITLNDNFFERIGVDFDFDIDDKIDRPFQVFGRQIEGTGDPATGVEPTRNTLDVDGAKYKNVTVGMQAPGVFSADLDIPFRQNSFGLAVPQFGGFDASAGAQLGFAILSDIEAFFFINAAQGDRRSNVLQAPKVTLFNGQQAFVSDTSQSPFVISVIPVVGDFAAAQQPVIVVLNEGTFMTVQAVISPDRRFVRLTVVPFFSKIGEVNEFQFVGSETTTENTSAAGNQDEPNDHSSNSHGSTVTREGTTVQLPTFSFVTVTTTVSVPDGGTVLLGGIKRLSEGRNEFGTPILNKIPYVSRLFKNVGIGRETQSLMMMVTPRIIIQEEEEERLGVLP